MQLLIMFTLGAAPNRYCDSLSCEFVLAALQLDRTVVFTLPDGKEDGDGSVRGAPHCSKRRALFGSSLIFHGLVKAHTASVGMPADKAVTGIGTANAVTEAGADRLFRWLRRTGGRIHSADAVCADLI